MTSKWRRSTDPSYYVTAENVTLKALDGNCPKTSLEKAYSKGRKKRALPGVGSGPPRVPHLGV